MTAPDCVITGAAVFDGRRFLPAGAAITVCGDRIVHVGLPPKSIPDGYQEIDGSGLILSPSFIDTHNHADYHCIESGNDGASLLAQGVGSIIVGNCGYSAVPTGTGPHPVLMPGKDGRNTDLETRRAEMDRGMALDVGDLMGHGTLRMAVLGEARGASAAEIDRMAGLLDDHLSDGGVGLSVGLNYPEAAGYDDREMHGLCRVLARHGRPLTCHIADQGAGILQAVREVIDWGDTAGCPVLVSHMRPISNRHDHLLDTLFAIFEERDRARFDLYPYAAGYTSLAWLFSYLFQRVPTQPNEIAPEEVENAAYEVCIGGLDDVRVLASAMADMAGHSIAELARRKGVQSGRMAQEILCADQGTLCLYERESRPETIDRIITHPLCLIGSDGYQFAGGHTGPCHPRCYGTFPGFLARYARSGLIDREVALARITADAADYFGFADRGRIAAGQRANLALLDWDALAEGEPDGKATDRLARGVALTMVGGRTAFVAPDRATPAWTGRRIVPEMPAGGVA